jgi:hypothetical protein
MRLIKLIASATLIATLALLAPHANAQTMGEYATTTAGVGTAGGSMGTSNDDFGGGSRTWGASSLGASFDERAGAASASGAGADFDSRAGSAGGLASDSRWPSASQFDGEPSDRFSDSSSRFQDQDRFTERTDLSASDRFPGGVLDKNSQGLDTHFSSSSGLDGSYSSN